MSITISGPIVFLKCKKCGRKTDHVLINIEIQLRFGRGQVEEIYECQECGKMKRIYEFDPSDVHIPAQHSVRELKEPQKKRRLF